MQQPTHYTTIEGGGWKAWPSWVSFNSEVLNLRNSERIEASPTDGRLPSGPLRVHSLAFADPEGGFGDFPRWDCINGWTQK